jgi:hypothetical protein
MARNEPFSRELIDTQLKDAGWSLTDDRVPANGGRQSVSHRPNNFALNAAYGATDARCL